MNFLIGRIHIQHINKLIKMLKVILHQVINSPTVITSNKNAQNKRRVFQISPLQEKYVIII